MKPRVLNGWLEYLLIVLIAATVYLLTSQPGHHATPSPTGSPIRALPVGLILSPRKERSRSDC